MTFFRFSGVVLFVLVQCLTGRLAEGSQHLNVYVSKVKGFNISDCGSIAHPCKTLASGFQALSPGGHLYVDGEETDRNPYTCQSTGQKLVIQKGFTMVSYIKTAHVSCSKGIIIQLKKHVKTPFKFKQPIQSKRLNTNPEKMVIFNEINFQKTTIVLKNTNVVIKDCVFTEGSPALRMFMMEPKPLPAVINVSGVVFKKNQGCIQVSTTQNRCETLEMSLQNAVFTENSGNPTGVIDVFGTATDRCCTYSLKLTMNNVTVYENYGLARTSTVNVKRKMRVVGKPSSSMLYQLLYPTEESFLEIQANYSVLLHFTNIKSTSNSNMRFLSLNSLCSLVNITHSSFHGHQVNNSGGVLFIKSPDNNKGTITVNVERSHFTNNVAEVSGGVLYVERGTKKRVHLRMVDTVIEYSYGNSTGCAIDTGEPDNLYVRIDRFVFKHCAAPCKKGDEHTCVMIRKGSVCIKAGIHGQVHIQNSLFSHNLNTYQSTLSLRLMFNSNEQLQKHTFQAYIQNVTFTKNVSPKHTGILQVKVDIPYFLQESLLEIMNCTFSGNTGQVIEVNRTTTAIIKKVTCVNNNGRCLTLTNNLVKQEHGSFYVWVLIRNCLFESNRVPLVIRHTRPQYTNITIERTIFRKNSLNEWGDAIKIKIGYQPFNNKSALETGTVTLDQVQFTGNHVHYPSGSVFGIVVMRHKGQFNATIRNCSFKDNFQERNKDGIYVTSDLVFLYLPKPCFPFPNATYRQRCKVYEFTTINYTDHVTFEKVSFQNNTAHSNIIYINNGKTTFRRCLFENNYSFHPRTSVHIFVEQGLPSLVLESSVFNQTQIRIFPHANKSDNPPESTNIMSFIYFAGQGPFIVKDSHFMITASEEVTPMFIIQNARFVHFDSTTQLSCPVGSFIKLDNSSHIIPKEFTFHRCPLNITRLKFTCRRCPARTYSLERGIVRGTRLKKTWIICNRCPYGGNCIKNVISRRSFWGYEEKKFPPQLKFEHCPESYCLSPTSSNPAIYNRCHGQRTGIMCGSCKRGFTESIFNHKCRAENDCHDGWFWVIAGVHSIVMALYIMHQPSIISYLIKKLLWFRENTNGAPPAPNSRVEQMKNLGSHTIHGYSKVVFYFYQIAKLLMLESCAEILQRDYFISMLISFYNFHVELVDDSMGCPFPGLTVVTKELFRSLQVYAVMACIVFFYLIAFFMYLITGRPKPSIAHYVAVIVEVLLLGYERLGHTSLELLSCTPLKIDGRTEWRLFLDGNITCWIHWWQYALIAYNIIFVLPFLVVLLIGTTKLRHQQISPWMFVIACFVPLPFLICWAFKWVLSKHRNGKQHNHRSSSNLQFQTTFSLLNVLQGPFRSPDSKTKGALYWESVLIGRRLVLLCLRSFVASPMIRLLCMTIVCIFVLVHNIIALPYKEKKTNYFSIAAQLTLVSIATINLSKATIIATGVQPKSGLLLTVETLKTIEIILLGVFPTVFGLLVTAALFSQAARLVLILKGRFIKSRVNLNSEYSEPLLGNSTESLLEE